MKAYLTTIQPTNAPFTPEETIHHIQLDPPYNKKYQYILIVHSISKTFGKQTQVYPSTPTAKWISWQIIKDFEGHITPLIVANTMGYTLEKTVKTQDLASQQ